MTTASIYLPNMTRTMQDGSSLMLALESGMVLSYGHFNDGEIDAIGCKEGKAVDFNLQRCSSRLSSVMLNALRNTSDNFYVGIGCACMWHGKVFMKALQYLNISSNNPFTLDRAPNSDAEACMNTLPNLNFSLSSTKQSRLTTGTAFKNANYKFLKPRFINLFKTAIFIIQL